MPGSRQYKIVISTIATYTTAYNHLRHTLTKAGIDDNNVITVYANEAHNDVSNNIIKLKNNLYEFTGFIGVHLMKDILPANTVFLLLHDTCSAGDNFKQRLEQMVNDFEEGIYWASRGGNCNICLYSKDAAEKAYTNLSSLLTISKLAAIAMEHNCHHLSLKQLPVKHRFHSDEPQHLGKRAVYDSEIIRDQLYYNSLDLMKYFVYIRTENDHPQRP
jgi:hypothetical protein